MKPLKIILLLFLCCAFLGCPYYSDVPLSKKQHKIGNFLVGKWKQCPEGSKCDYLLITRNTDYEYNLTYRSFDTSSSGWKTITKRGHLSNLGSDWYLNVKAKDQYQVSKVIQYPSKLYIYGLAESAFSRQDGSEIKFQSSQEFRDYIDFYQPKTSLFLGAKVFEKY